MAAKPLQLSNGSAWRTRTAAKQHFREMRDRYGAGATVSDPKDDQDLRALLEHYDTNWEPKKGAKPISSFSVNWNGAEGRNTLSFFIHYEDGTKDDFSFEGAVDHDPAKHA